MHQKKIFTQCPSLPNLFTPAIVPYYPFPVSSNFLLSVVLSLSFKINVLLFFFLAVYSFLLYKKYSYNLSLLLRSIKSFLKYSTFVIKKKSYSFFVCILLRWCSLIDSYVSNTFFLLPHSLFKFI